MLENYAPADCSPDVSLIDSFPIVTCKGRNRKGKVAREIADKGYCSTKNMHYYGLKLHNLGFRRKGTIPFPEMMTLSAASENDYKVFVREFDPYLNNRTVFADKSYVDDEFFSNREISQNYQILTPVKLVKGEAECIRQREKAANDLFSYAVSAVREPIESFFNWLNTKTKIQAAQTVRSTAGLLVHIFAKMATAFVYLIF
ncbi:MAG: transposase [Paludibacteraceae bacterium]